MRKANELPNYFFIYICREFLAPTMNYKTTLNHMLHRKNMNFAFFSIACLLGFQSFSQDYCIPVLSCLDDDTILNVTLESLTNSSTCSSNGYNDFTSLTAPTLHKLSSHPIAVEVGSGWMTEVVSVWIDYNSNGIFEDSEFSYIGQGSGSTVNGSISIPGDVTTGEKRMRVRVAAVAPITATSDMACDETQEYGETEDYTVSIQEPLKTNDFEKNAPKIYKLKNSLNIHSANEALDRVEFYDVTGKLVYKKSAINNNRFAMDASNYSNQVLLIRIVTVDGIVHTKKLAN